MAEAQDMAVQAHYKAYPYPARDPADEANRQIEGSPSRLPEIEHYLFGGRAPDPFRALIAGGGTGDAAIMLAQHMMTRGLAGEVVWLDMSDAARAVAKARAAARGLTNIRFVSGSLLEARAAVGDGFDYVDCCGVLHHLDEPETGIQALRDVLRDDGGMGVMVYGAIGRRGVSDMQALAERLALQDLSP
jgi:ubiquinone/menaquinone biosynthesis C-methylase UbiE